MLWFYEFFFPVVWIFFVLYWQIKAADTKATQRLEPAASRILRALAFLIVIILLSTTFVALVFLVFWAKLRMEEKWMLPIRGDVCHLCPSDSRASAVPFLIAM